MGGDTPNSVRIRTGDGNEHRYYAIEDAADFYDCNRSDAVARACDAVPAVARAVQKVLNRDDLTTEQKREIAETFSTRGLSFEVESVVRTDFPDQ
jgi:hypothetical protein